MTAAPRLHVCAFAGCSRLPTHVCAFAGCSRLPTHECTCEVCRRECTVGGSYDYADDAVRACDEHEQYVAGHHAARLGRRVAWRRGATAWEYNVATLPNDGGASGALNVFGRDGWEAVGVVPAADPPGAITIVLKRRARGEANADGR